MKNSKPTRPIGLIRPIRNEADYDAALADIGRLMDAKSGTRAGDRLDILVTLVEAYDVAVRIAHATTIGSTIGQPDLKGKHRQARAVN